ncbi:hypothetical protein ACFLRW_05865 [Acidobacteriota bacterium]
MSLEIREVKTQKDLKEFIQFPFHLYRNDPFWTPPLLRDEQAFYDPNRNSRMRDNPHLLLLAFKDGRTSGRILGLVNERANSLKNQKYARWTFLDCIDDKSTVHSLLERVEKWGKEKGMTSAVGPRGFSDQEPQGAIVEGFEERAAIGTHYNRPFLIDHITGFGYEKDVDWVSYKIYVPETLPEIYQSIREETLKKTALTHLSFTKKTELKPLIVPIFRLFNETYKVLYSFAPISEGQMKSLEKKYLPILDPRFIQVIKDKNRLVAFAVVMPDLTAGLKKAKGHLYPFGFIHILRAKKRTKVLQFLIVGIHQDYQGQGIFTLFAEYLKKVIHEAGMEWIDSHLELEDNIAIRKWMERLGGKVYRRHRAYIKTI